jgi:hypothetical protein
MRGLPRLYQQSSGLLVGFLLVLALSGCRTPEPVPYFKKGGEVVLPRWMTQPEGRQQRDVPVRLGMLLPAHLEGLAEQYALPGWMVYGVVRALGYEGFDVRGVVKTYRLRDAAGESRFVVDELYYNVPVKRVEDVLLPLSKAYAGTQDDGEREALMAPYVYGRLGGLVLFGLPTGDSPRVLSDAEEHWLSASSVSEDPVERFEVGSSVWPQDVGWTETPEGYQVTAVGAFLYGRPVEAFRKVEEEAIRELARGSLLKLSHMSRMTTTHTRAGGNDDSSEDVVREELALVLRGVRVLRRCVDMDTGYCAVTVMVPKDGVAKAWKRHE